MTEPLLNDKLNLETARIAWADLQSHFARGAAVYVSPDVDLIAAARLVADDAQMTESLQDLVSIKPEEAMTELMMAKFMQEASLSVISQIIQPTLLNFLR